MLTLYVLHFLYAPHNLFLVGGWFEDLVAASLGCLFEEQHSLLVHEEVQELLFLLGEKRTILIFKLGHPSNLFVVIFDGVVRSSAIDDQAHPVFNIFECFETPMQIFNQFG
jgi:hypothetical protein